MVTSPFGIAQDRAVGIAHQPRAVLLDRLVGDGVALAVLLALELLHGFDQHFRIGHQIVADRFAEPCFVAGREDAAPLPCRLARDAGRQDDSDGHEAAAQNQKDGTHAGHSERGASISAWPGVDVGLDVLGALPGGRALLELALGRRGMRLRFGPMAAEDRHLGARERSHAGIVEPGIARGHQAPQLETAQLDLAGEFEVAHRLAVVVRLVGFQQGAGKIDLNDADGRQELHGAAIGGTDSPARPFSNSIWPRSSWK